jgi:hypothetical protein
MPRNAKRRADLDQVAGVALGHPAQRSARPIDRTEEGDLHPPPVLLGGDLDERGEHGCHGVVDPHVDGPQFPLHPLGGRLHLGIVGHVHLHHQRLPAAGADLLRGRLEAVAVAGQ